MKPPEMPSGASRNATDVHADLRARILSLDLPPDSVLSRADLQAEYGVSSTPMRDAILRLQDEGLVEVRPQSRSVVTRIDLGYAEDAHFLRACIETDLVRELAGRDGAGLVAKLGHLVDLQRGAVADADLEAFSTLDLGFHRALFEAAGRLRLFDLIRRESTHIDRLRALDTPTAGKVGRIVTEHDRIIAAIEARAPAAAEAAMAFHLSQSMRIGSELSLRRPEYFAR